VHLGHRHRDAAGEAGDAQEREQGVGRQAERPFRVPLYPLTPIVFVAAALLIVVNTIVVKPAQSAIGVGFALLGIPAYRVWRARSR